MDISSMLRQLVDSDASEVASAFMQSISNMQTTSCDPSQLLQASRRDVHQYEAWQLDPGPNWSLPPSESLKTLSFEASIQLSDVNVVAAPVDVSSLLLNFPQPRASCSLQHVDHHHELLLHRGPLQ